MATPYSAYPLTWPEGWKRTLASFRRAGQFNKKDQAGSRSDGGTQYRKSTSKALAVSDGVSRILVALEKMGVDRQDVIISTNVRTRLDGLPRAGEQEPDDPGAAVYWQPKGKEMRTMAIDQYTRVADNLAAIAATLEAMRAIERHGGAEILNRTFTGFKALPQTASQSWREVLGLDVNCDLAGELVKARYRELVKVYHPDGTSPNGQKFQAVSDAFSNARKEMGL